MEDLLILVLIVLLIFFAVLGVYDYIKLCKERKEEILRRETIKNSLQTIAETLISINDKME